MLHSCRWTGSFYECAVDRVDGNLEVVACDTDDDVELARTLVDHADVHTCGVERTENLRRGTVVGFHAAAYDCDQRKVSGDIDVIGVAEFVDLREDRLLLLLELMLMHEDGESVDAGGHMLETDAVVLEGLQSLAAETDLRVHHVLLNVDRGEALLAGDAGDGEGRLAGRIFHDERAFVLRRVCILDVDRDARRADREDRVLMEHACAHVGELAELTVRDRLDDAGILDDVRIGYEEAGHVGPVLIEVRMHRARDDGTGDVGSASGKCLDSAVGIRSVKSGDDGVRQALKSGGEQLLRCVGVEGAVLEETDVACGVDKLKTEIVSKKNTVQILAAGSSVVASGMSRKILADGLKLRVEVSILST